MLRYFKKAAVLLLLPLILTAGCKQRAATGSIVPDPGAALPSETGEHAAPGPEESAPAAVTPSPTPEPFIRELYYADALPMGSAAATFGGTLERETLTRSAERMRIACWTGAGQGNDELLIEMLLNNELDIILLPVEKLSEIVPEGAAFNGLLQFAGISRERIDTVLNGENPFTDALRGALSLKQITSAGFVTGGGYNTVYLDKRPERLSDLKGRYTPETECKADNAFFQAVGMKIKYLGETPLEQAMEFAAVTAVAGNSPALAQIKRYEYQRFLWQPQFRLNACAVLVRTGALELLEDGERKVLFEALAEAAKQTGEEMFREEKDALDTIAAAGVEVLPADEALITEMKASEGVRRLTEAADAASNGLVGLLLKELNGQKEESAKTEEEGEGSAHIGEQPAP